MCVCVYIVRYLIAHNFITIRSYILHEFKGHCENINSNKYSHIDFGNFLKDTSCCDLRVDPSLFSCIHN
jgi:hypothetical protein